MKSNHNPISQLNINTRIYPKLIIEYSHLKILLGYCKKVFPPKRNVDFFELIQNLLSTSGDFIRFVNSQLPDYFNDEPIPQIDLQYAYAYYPNMKDNKALNDKSYLKDLLGAAAKSANDLFALASNIATPASNTMHQTMDKVSSNSAQRFDELFDQLLESSCLFGGYTTRTPLEEIMDPPIKIQTTTIAADQSIPEDPFLIVSSPHPTNPINIMEYFRKEGFAPAPVYATPEPENDESPTDVLAINFSSYHDLRVEYAALKLMLGTCKKSPLCKRHKEAFDIIQNILEIMDDFMRFIDSHMEKSTNSDVLRELNYPITTEELKWAYDCITPPNRKMEKTDDAEDELYETSNPPACNNTFYRFILSQADSLSAMYDDNFYASLFTIAARQSERLEEQVCLIALPLEIDVSFPPTYMPKDKYLDLYELLTTYLQIFQKYIKETYPEIYTANNAFPNAIEMPPPHEDPEMTLND